ncbi:MAG TPA: pilin [bacterium]|nr:pilin [bacterium]HPV65718.1 pilin [bacterium]
MKNFLKQFLFVFFLVSILTIPFFSLAQISDSSVTDKLKQTGFSAGFSRDTNEFTLSETIGRIVSTALSLIGVVFIILIILGGYQWMTAGGNEEQVSKAKDRIKNAIIGLVITVSAYAIWALIEEYFLNTI